MEERVGRNVIKNGDVDFEHGVGFVHSIVIFNICIMQNMVLVSGAQLFNWEFVKFFVNS